MFFFFLKAEDGIREYKVTEVQTCALPIWFKPDASLRRVVVERILPVAERGAEATARARVEVPLGSLARHAGGSSALPVSVPSFGLEDGDVVVVDALPDEPEAYFVAITGMIQDPGRYPWRPGMTLRDLVRLARGPRVGDRKSVV